MDHTAIENSSTIKSVAYDLPSRVLEVIFHNGGHYSYADVPEDLAAALFNADSKGKHFHANIRGKFKHTKLG